MNGREQVNRLWLNVLGMLVFHNSNNLRIPHSGISKISTVPHFNIVHAKRMANLNV
uniref:Uncharacterized protein n=1 Tax=Meloidogyne incognita TaxID=6306 RepID=A0A914LCY7_MELIC